MQEKKENMRIKVKIICREYFLRIKLDINDLNLAVNKLSPPSHPALNSACKSEQELLGVLMWLLAKKILWRDRDIFDITFDIALDQLFEKISFFYKRIEEPCSETRS
ncbi:hypothetical protein [Legionella fallonii]|nr:hypothetical protein [Legionella fallonii]